ncbi:lipopolysaccharide assembly protein LapB [Ramlibacter sp. 2FC]|uniref:lipopolysaccharide assembly protein LapB n=1 Tax=Ramlibacter sp. 2FC TaxID=2502188 RepID=UPI0010F5067E|nr:lipopolysaccharide assembly protein LapB [Ramlibacter sp. 2FC]
MDFSLSWILLGLPLAFGLGWVASRLDLRQLRIDNRQAPKAYFKGLNFLLNEQQDQAIDAFIEAVQNDPDTSELHFALGNLFRRRGEYERAVRVHEHLLSRGDLSEADRQRAQHALALDFLKAGLLDRAEDALRKLEGTPFANQARLARLAIYERSREWPQAAEMARKLEAAGEASFTGRLAHYLCEQAAGLTASGDTAAARQLLEQAVADAPQSARPRIQLAALQRTQGQDAQALETLTALVEALPPALPLAAAQLAKAAGACGQAAKALALLKAGYHQTPSLDVLEAMVALESSDPASAATARDWYIRHLEREPSLIAAARWLAGERLEREPCHPPLQRALDHAAKPLNRYRCAACGFEAKEHFWQCPGCQAWDSYPPRRVEEL